MILSGSPFIISNITKSSPSDSLLTVQIQYLVNEEVPTIMVERLDMVRIDCQCSGFIHWAHCIGYYATHDRYGHIGI